MCAKQLGAGELMAQSASCPWRHVCLCPTALCRGPEIKAQSQTQVNGAGQNGLMVDTRKMNGQLRRGAEPVWCWVLQRRPPTSRFLPAQTEFSSVFFEFLRW